MSESAEERGLTEFYRRVRKVRPPEGQGLNDLYVRFYRMAERRIAEQTGRGVVCFISNYSWLDGLIPDPEIRDSYRVLRGSDVM
jgi:predicted helicase